MKFAFKVKEATDKNGNPYFWGYMKIGMCDNKVTIFKSKKPNESDVWNVFLDQVEDKPKPQQNNYPKNNNSSDIPF